MELNHEPTASTEQNPDLRNLVLLCYVLHLLAFVSGGLTGIVAVIIAYLKKADVKCSWLHSHLGWQLRTFWLGALFTLACILSMFGLLMSGSLLFVLTWSMLLVCTIWVLYRHIKGLLRLLDRMPMHGV